MAAAAAGRRAFAGIYGVGPAGPYKYGENSQHSASRVRSARPRLADFVQRHRARALPGGREVIRQGGVEVGVEHFDVELEVQAQAARVQVGRADLRVVVVDQQDLAVHERRRLVADLDAVLQQLPQHVARGPVHVGQVVLARQQDGYLHAAQGRRLQGAEQLARRQEVGRHDGHAPLRGRHRRQQHQRQAVQILVRAVGDDPAGRAARAAPRPASVPAAPGRWRSASPRRTRSRSG